jgi:DNA-binding NarL/FixJ family response regulator
MAHRRVLIMESDHLRSAGVRSLLSNQDDLHVRAAIFTSFKDMSCLIDDFQPDVVVMYDDVLEEPAHRLTASLAGFSGLRTIIVHWEDNEIEIYESQKVKIRELEDFLAVI